MRHALRSQVLAVHCLPLQADLDHHLIFPELRNAALIRELHVYGQLVATEDARRDHSQHQGFGRCAAQFV